MYLVATGSGTFKPRAVFYQNVKSAFFLPHAISYDQRVVIGRNEIWLKKAVGGGQNDDFAAL
jgi:hypothetical protein